jgi:regulator of sirC expression with transglutaminase-like and TPR domain
MTMRSHTRADIMGARTLGELVRRLDARVEHAAIWIARDAHPQLMPAQVTAGLDALASDFEAEQLDELDAHEQATALVHHVALKHGFRGNPRDYYDPENSYLDSVLKRKQGIPITLAVVYVALGERINIPIVPIGFPGHFLVRVGADDGVYVDPFEGRILAHPDLELLLSRALGPSSVLTSEHLTRVDVSQLAQRMLLNLKRIHEGRRDHARAFLVTERLVELATTPELRRDRGLLALKLGAHQVASMDLAHYLLKRPNAKDAKEVRSALTRSRKSTSLTN